MRNRNVQPRPARLALVAALLAATTLTACVVAPAPVVSDPYGYPVGGSASRPRHLLSCSGDGTTRLWSLDTFSALVSYRGHQYPVWDVTWAPLGTYFATASADRTAKMIPQAEYLVDEGAPHGLFYTHKDALNRDLIAFAKNGKAYHYVHSADGKAQMNNEEIGK